LEKDSPCVIVVLVSARGSVSDMVAESVNAAIIILHDAEYEWHKNRVIVQKAREEI